MFAITRLIYGSVSAFNRVLWRANQQLKLILRLAMDKYRGSLRINSATALRVVDLRSATQVLCRQLST